MINKQVILSINKLLNQYMTIKRENLIIYGCENTKVSDYSTLKFQTIEACVSLDETILYNEEDSISAVISTAETSKLLKEFYRVISVLGALIILEKKDSPSISEAELIGFRYVGQSFNNGVFITILIKTSSALDKINYDYLVFTRDQYYRDISQQLVSKIISGFDNIIVDINLMNKLELTEVSIIKTITIYTKNSIENVRMIMLKIKEELSEIRGIDVTAKRISQNKVHIFSPLVGLNIFIYNLFHDFDKLFSKKDSINKEIMLEHSYHQFAFLNTLDMNEEWNKIKYLEEDIFSDIIPLLPRKYTPTLSKVFPRQYSMIIGLHKFGYEIGPIEVIYIGDQKKLKNDIESVKQYSLSIFNGDFLLRGPYMDIYDMTQKRVVYRVYMVNGRCIPYENYTLSMKYLMSNFILDRPLTKNLDILKRACAGIIKYHASNTAGDFKCMGDDVSDQYKYEVQIWEQPKWLFKITI